MISLCTDRFQSCSYASSNPLLTAVGPRLVPTTACDGFSMVMLFVAEFAAMGMANGGLALSAVTTFVVGSCVMIA